MSMPSPTIFSLKIPFILNLKFKIEYEIQKLKKSTIIL